MIGPTSGRVVHRGIGTAPSACRRFSAVLAAAITWRAPARLSNWINSVPTPPAAALTRTDLPATGVCRVKANAVVP
jgi:hypothetical protein